MKKLLSVLLVFITLLSMAAPVSAADNTTIAQPDTSITLEEFKKLPQGNALLGNSNFQSFNGTDIHEKGYYYTHLSAMADNRLFCAYDMTDSEYQKKWSESLNREAWVSDGYINLDVMLGVVYGSAEYYEIFEACKPIIWAGMWACRFDNPAFFDRFTNSVTFDVVLSHNQYNVITNFDVYAVFEDHPYYREAHETTFNNKVAQIVNEANKKSSQLEAVLYVHDYLINNAEYDERDVALNSAYSNTEAYYYAHSAFGVLNKKLGVCESYAKAFKIICDRLNNGPECALVTSNTHMWNIVQMDGKWYCLDVTWDDPIGGTISDTYFLCGDPDVVDGASNDHVPETKYGITHVYASDRYHNHSLKYVAQVNATETATGTKAHYKCNGCSMVFSDAAGKNRTTPAALTIDALGITVSKPSITAANASGGVKISWKAVSKAEKYYVYRRTSSSGSWKRIKETTDLSYVDTTAASGSSYQYAVRAVRSSVVSGYSNVETVKYLTSTKPTVKNAASGMTASWSKVTGATGYIVYRRQKTSSGWSDWTKLTTTKSLSYTDKTAKVGTDYRYAAVAYSGSTKAYRATSSTVRRLVVSSVKTAVNENTLKTTWSKVTGAEDYVVYRSQLSGKKWSAWKAVATTSKTSYTDKSVKSGVTYKYSVRARYSEDRSVMKEGKSILMLTMPKVTVTADTKSITAKWGKVTGASGYTVYRRQKTADGWSSWKNLGNQKSLSYTDKKATAGVQYQYTVKAYSGSMRSDIKTSTAVSILSTPKVSIANRVGGVRVSWKEIAGADSYVVYRSYKKSGKWTDWKKVATTEDVSVLDKTASSGIIYRYYVRAISGTNKSGYKASASLRYLATPTVSAAAQDQQVKVTWKKITGATGYTVYRRQKTASGWSGWTNLGNQKSCTYTDKKATAGVQYQYAAKAYRGSVKSYFKASAAVTTLGTPKVTVENSLESIVVNWGKVTGATQYRVYRRELSGDTWSSWKRLTVTEDLSYVDTTFEEGKVYQYTVRGVKGDIASGFKASKSIMFVEAPSDVLPPSETTVYWQKVEGATAYYIYRRTWDGGSPSSDWEKIGEVDDAETEYDDTTAQSGNTYQYAVRTVKGAYISAMAECGAYYYLATPTFQATSLNGVVNIRITPVNGVTAYVIWKHDGSGWKEIEIGNRTSYTDTDVVVGKTYQYHVQGQKGNMNTAPSVIKRITVQ